jgi:hypothetical protein
MVGTWHILPVLGSRQRILSREQTLSALGFKDKEFCGVVDYI